MSKEDKKITPKSVAFETELLDKLKDEALTGENKTVYRGHVTPLINDIIRDHYKRKEKAVKK